MDVLIGIIVVSSLSVLFLFWYKEIVIGLVGTLAVVAMTFYRCKPHRGEDLDLRRPRIVPDRSSRGAQERSEDRAGTQPEDRAGTQRSD